MREGSAVTDGMSAANAGESSVCSRESHCRKSEGSAPLTRQEAGRLGGLATLDKFGIYICPTCGLPQKSEHFAEIGHKGGLIGGMVTKLKNKSDYYSRIGKLGGRPRRKVEV